MKTQCVGNYRRKYWSFNLYLKTVNAGALNYQQEHRIRNVNPQ